MTMQLTMPAAEALGRYIFARDKAAALLQEAQCLGDHERYVAAIDAVEVSLFWRMVLGTNALPMNEALLQMIAMTQGWDDNLSEGGPVPEKVD